MPLILDDPANVPIVCKQRRCGRPITRRIKFYAAPWADLFLCTVCAERLWLPSHLTLVTKLEGETNGVRGT